MKQKDIAIIIAVAGFSTVVAFILANVLLATPKNQQAPVKVLDSISSTFPAANNKYYNTSSIDPTQTVQIGDTTNSQPFSK
jgi:hypothetical protein